MAVSSNRSIVVAMTGDISYSETFAAAANAAAPPDIQTITQVVGNLTITPPTGGTTPKAVTIVPPAGNTSTITLKGVAGDTGVVLHLTDPTTIALNNPTGTFVLTIGVATITGLRLIWS